VITLREFSRKISPSVSFFGHFSFVSIIILQFHTRRSCTAVCSADLLKSFAGSSFYSSCVVQVCIPTSSVVTDNEG